MKNLEKITFRRFMIRKTEFKSIIKGLMKKENSFMKNKKSKWQSKLRWNRMS